jgi:hypothetical protein
MSGQVRDPLINNIIQMMLMLMLKQRHRTAKLIAAGES